MLFRGLSQTWSQIKMVDLKTYLTSHKDKVFHTITLAGVMSASMAGIIWPYHRTLGIVMVVVCALCNGVLVITVMSLCCAACVEHYVDAADTRGLGRMCKELSYCCCGCCWYCYEENFKGGGDSDRLLLNDVMGGRASHGLDKAKGPSSLSGNGYSKLVSSESGDLLLQPDSPRRLKEDDALRCALEDLTEPKPEIEPSQYGTSASSPYYHLTTSSADKGTVGEGTRDKLEVDPFLADTNNIKKDGKQKAVWAQRCPWASDSVGRPVLAPPGTLRNTAECTNNTTLGLENDIVEKNGGDCDLIETSVPATRL